MNFQELETAKRLGLAVVNIVWSDSAYGVIEMHQQRKFGRLAGTKFTNPDWVALAESFGLPGLRVGSAAELVRRRSNGRSPLDVPSVVEIPDRLPRELHLLPDAHRPQPELTARSVSRTPARSAARSYPPSSTSASGVCNSPSCPAMSPNVSVDRRREPRGSST